jgi:hypothetical protein
MELFIGTVSAAGDGHSGERNQVSTGLAAQPDGVRQLAP